MQKILEMPDTMLSVSCTTRKPRPAEAPGKWYNFVSEEEFQRMADKGEFLEHFQVFGKNWYGTPWKNWQEAKQKGLDLVLEIDVQGAREVQQGKLREYAVSIFILPPSREELEHRIRARSANSEDDIQRRLKQAKTEIGALAEYYDYFIVNDDIERAGAKIQEIVRRERARTFEERRVERMGAGAMALAEQRRKRLESDSQAQMILQSFGG